MTLDIAILTVIFVALVYLFLTEKLPLDLTAFLGLAVLVLGGFVRPDEAFRGFASPAVITTLFIFLLGGALQQTGVADAIGRQAHRLAGGRELWLMVVVMLTAGLLSSFMPNVATTAVMMPAVASLAQRSSVPAS
ncbi:SLC13 family permease, partial [bacterium]|nr:SLC13 family permease [bacterium]